MKDIPFFTTDYGIASLILKEIPYKGVAFVRVRSVQPGKMKEHLDECVAFCRAAGADRVLAAGDEGMEAYPLESIVYQMSLGWTPQESEDNLWPVTEETVSRWREIYNQAMRPFDNHGTLTAYDEKTIIASGGAYFVHCSGKLLGIGWMEGNRLLALVSVEPGMGQRVAKALFSTVNGERITLEVVSSNLRAIRLYEKMGFIKSGERNRWYRVL